MTDIELYSVVVDETDVEDTLSSVFSARPNIVENASTKLKQNIASECAGCKQRFRDVRDFDLHRVGGVLTRHCLPVDVMTGNRYWKQDKRGYWRYTYKGRKVQEVA